MIGTLNMDSGKILITGSGGFIGSNLYKLLAGEGFSVSGIDLKTSSSVDCVCDTSDENQLSNFLRAAQPKIVVHLSAFSNVDKCEIERDFAYRSNVLATKNLCQYCQQNGCRMIYISTDYVYDGKTGNYNEQSLTAPLQYYGQTKLDSEKLVQNLNDYVILRPTVVFGWDPNGMNFFMQLIRKLKAGEKMNVPKDQISNPTYVLDLCRAIVELIKKKSIKGIFVATGPQAYSRVDLAKIIAKEFALNHELITPLATSELKQLAQRPLNNSTNSNLLYKTIGFDFSNINESFASIRRLID